MEREEIDAMWERIKALEENSLVLAQTVGSSIVTLAYNSMLTAITVAKPAELSAFIKYMGPKLESAQQVASSAGSMEDALKAAVDFQNDCITYSKSRM
jgi:hypothetical protein